MAFRTNVMLAAVLMVMSVCWIDTAEAVSPDSIAGEALRRVGDTNWMFSSDPEDTNKCNLFVADVLEAVNARAPQRYPTWFTNIFGLRPIGAGEWGNPDSTYLRDNDCWERRSSAAKGYVIGGEGHVGIVTGSSKTTSAPTQRAVDTNDWGFRSGQSVTFWEYVC